MIDSGSYRLSGSGKQLGRKKVPYKGSDLHVTTVLDNACEKISDKFVRFEQYPDVFVEKSLQSNLKASTTASCKPVRSLYGLCSNAVDDFEDQLRTILRGRTELLIDEWTDEFCGANGILRGACAPGIDPGSAEEVVNNLRIEQDKSANGTDETKAENVEEKKPEVASDTDTLAAGTDKLSKEDL